MAKETQEFLRRLFRPNTVSDLVDPIEEAVETEIVDEDLDGPDRSAYQQLEHTQRSNSDNPLYRASFWIGVIGVASAGLYVFASQMGASLQMGQKNTYTTPTEEPEEVDEAIQADEKEIRVAFADQDAAQIGAEAVMAAEERAKRQQATNRANRAANETAANPPRPRPRSTPQPPSPRNTLTLPRRVPQTSQPRAFTPRPSAPAPQRTPPTPRPAPQRSTPPAEEPQVDAAQLYASFDEIGSYGSASRTSPGESTSDNAFAAQPISTNSDFFDGEDGNLYLRPGESIEMELKLPITWSQAQTAPKTLAVVTKGTQSMPAGMQVVITSSGDNSGIVQVNHLALVDGDQTIPLRGAMQITKSNGKPLKAKKKGGPGFFNSIGVKTLLGLGSSVASSALSGDSVTINNGSTSVTQDRGVLRSVLESGSNELLSDLQRQGQRGLQQNQNQEYFVVEAGNKIMVSAVSNVGG